MEFASFQLLMPRALFYFIRQIIDGEVEEDTAVIPVKFEDKDDSDEEESEDAMDTDEEEEAADGISDFEGSDAMSD